MPRFPRKSFNEIRTRLHDLDESLLRDYFFFMVGYCSDGKSFIKGVEEAQTFFGLPAVTFTDGSPVPEDNECPAPANQ